MFQIKEVTVPTQRVIQLVINARSEAQWNYGTMGDGFLICVNSALDARPNADVVSSLDVAQVEQLKNSAIVKQQVEDVQCTLQYVSKRTYEARGNLSLAAIAQQKPCRVQVWICEGDGTSVYIPTQESADECKVAPVSVLWWVEEKKKFLGKTQYTLHAEGLEILKDTALYNKALAYRVEGQSFDYPVLGKIAQDGFSVYGKDLRISFVPTPECQDVVKIKRKA